MEALNEVRAKAQELYKGIGEIHCPYLKEKVHFNSAGFNHLQFRGNRNKRHKNVQEIRCRLIQLAPLVIRDSKTLQEYEEQSLFIEVKVNKKTKTVLKRVQFFGFIAIVKNRKVKVIVRQIGNGQKHFWSIIPNWKTRKSKEGIAISK